MERGGIVVAVVGAIFAGYLLLVPVQVTALGYSATCGAPLLAVRSEQPFAADPTEAALLDVCKGASSPRAIIGLVGGTGLVIVGLGSAGQARTARVQRELLEAAQHQAVLAGLREISVVLQRLRPTAPPPPSPDTRRG